MEYSMIIQCFPLCCNLTAWTSNHIITHLWAYIFIFKKQKQQGKPTMDIQPTVQPVAPVAVDMPISKDTSNLRVAAMIMHGVAVVWILANFVLFFIFPGFTRTISS
jgi:hypothetical protein